MKTPSKIHEIALLIFLQIFFIGNITMSQIKNENNNKPEDVNLTIIYDNNPMKNGLQTDWGFACLVEVGKTKLLFDTGDNGGILLGNMAKLNVSL